MRKYLQLLVGRDTLSLPQLSVLTVDNRDVSHSVMKENSTRESVMQRGKKSSLFIHQINHIQSITEITGGAIIGIRWAMEESLISREDFLSSLKSSSKMYLTDHYIEIPHQKIVSSQIRSISVRIAISSSAAKVLVIVHTEKDWLSAMIVLTVSSLLDLQFVMNVSIYQTVVHHFTLKTLMLAKICGIVKGASDVKSAYYHPIYKIKSITLRIFRTQRKNTLSKKSRY